MWEMVIVSGSHKTTSAEWDTEMRVEILNAIWSTLDKGLQL